MDQFVGREPKAAPPIAETLGLSPEGKAKRKRRRWPWVVLVFAMLAGGGGAYLLQGGATPSYVFATVPAEKGDLTVEVTATGTLQPLTQVDISSELSGVMRSVAVNENQHIKKGDVLAELDTARLKVQVERAEASVKAAEANLAVASTTLAQNERALARTTQLSQRGMATQEALDTATAERDRAQSQVLSAEANLAIAQADLKSQQTDLAKSTLYSPIDGVVLTRSVDPGQTVASSLQAPVLFVIAADLSQMELDAAIDEADIGAVKPGQDARFTVDAYPERRFDADIRDIAYASVTTDNVVTYAAKLDVDNKDLLLRPGMTATVSIITREARDVITVPASALRFSPPQAEQRQRFSLRNIFAPGPRFPRGGQRRQAAGAEGTRTLYVLENGRPRPVAVRTGASDGDRVEILSGLEGGERVVLSASQARS